MDIVSFILSLALEKGSDSPSASSVTYDPSTSVGLISTDVQDAIDELSTKLGMKMVTVSELPEIGEEDILYIVPKSTPEQGNFSDEYTWNEIEQDYDKVGDTLISPLPAVTSSDNGKLLGVVSGVWDKVKNPNDNIASAYDSTATYAVGDLCIYNNDLYECNTAISVAEAWDSTHWTQATVAGQLANSGKDVIYYPLTKDGINYNLVNTAIKVSDIISQINSGKIVRLIWVNNLGRAYIFDCYGYTSNNILFVSFGFDTDTYWSIGSVSLDGYSFRSQRNGYLLTMDTRGSASDVGKYIRYNSSGLLEKGTIPKELPAVTSSDEGKFLTVDSSGNWVADDLPDGTNTSY